MPSSQKFRDFVVGQFKGEQFNGGFRVTTRKMMGEYILYADGKVFGGIYDDRLLVKPVPAALKLLPNAKKQLPYDGAKPMLRITDEQIADSAFLAKLLDAMLPEVPAPKKKQSLKNVFGAKLKCCRKRKQREPVFGAEFFAQWEECIDNE